jgi:hypothetical protein
MMPIMSAQPRLRVSVFSCGGAVGAVMGVPQWGHAVALSLTSRVHSGHAINAM